MNMSTLDHDEEMIAASPVFKTPPNNANTNVNITNNINQESMMDISSRGRQFETPHNSNNNSNNCLDLRRPTLHHQHSYAGHEAAFSNAARVNHSNYNNNHNNDLVARAPSGHPFLATRHLSIEELDRGDDTMGNVDVGLDTAMLHATPPSFLATTTQQQSNNDHSFLLMNNDISQGFAVPAFTPTNSINNNGSIDNSTARGDDGQRQPPSPPLLSSSSMGNNNIQQPPLEQPPSPPRGEETAEERARREDEESVALAQMLMAEEAMASHRMSADFLRMNSDQFSAEDFAALQNALQEEEAEAEDEYDDHGEEEEEDHEGDMSYEALLQLGERIGDVKTDRWTMIAHKEIAKLETFEYDPAATATATTACSSNHDGDGTNSDATLLKRDIDDSEIKCLVCQFAYEKGDKLRRLPCKHCFHQECIDEWLKTKDICAYCRQSICSDNDTNS